MRFADVRSLSVFVSLFATTLPLFAQWDQTTPGQISTRSIIAIGPAGSTATVQPSNNASLRLSYPTGAAGAPCTDFPTDLYTCMQLAFGVPSGMFWGFKLDPTNDLHLIRFEDNVGWREGMTFRRTGNVSINGGNKPLRIDAVNAGGFGAEFIDLSPSGVPNGVGLHMTGNSFIVASNVRIGNWGVPVVESNTSTSPLYLNRWTQTDVVVGATHHTNTGVRVESAGSSYFRGSVGIGTAAPSATHRLHVVGNARVDGVLEGTYIKAHFQDLAEWVPSTIDLAPATVVVLDSARANHVLPSSRAYDASVAGVVSAQPGIALGEAGDSKALIATTGRVRVRVDASQQPIAIGDLLVTSGKPGLAMKSIPLDLQGIAIHRPGTIVGKALESLPSGEGEILVLLSLQ